MLGWRWSRWHQAHKQPGLWQVAGAYSKTWSNREEALLTLHKQLGDAPVGTPKEDLKSALRASIFLIRRAIRDIVTPVSPPPLSGPGICDQMPGHSPGRHSNLGVTWSLASCSVHTAVSLGVKLLEMQSARGPEPASAVPSGPDRHLSVPRSW